MSRGSAKVSITCPSLSFWPVAVPAPAAPWQPAQGVNTSAPKAMGSLAPAGGWSMAYTYMNAHSGIAANRAVAQ